MKVRDFIKQEVDIDVYDDVCEELAIAFCGPLSLTSEGEAHFEFVLNLDIDVQDDTAIVHVDDEFFPGLWEFKLKKAQEFFSAAAGYCSEENYNRWFKTETEE